MRLCCLDIDDIISPLDQILQITHMINKRLRHFHSITNIPEETIQYWSLLLLLKNSVHFHSIFEN